MKTGPAHVVSIPPGVAFLPTLVENLLNGHLIDGFAPHSDPLALSSLTIWVPTRRAVRALATEFASRMDTGAALLPDLRALGDSDDDSLFIEDEDIPTLTPTISEIERHLILSRLVAAWAEQLNPRERDLYQGAEIVVPSSLSDAVWFAADLAHLMDMVATEEVCWKSLDTLVPDDHAQWWKLTLEFLKIATVQWPAILNEKGLQDKAVMRAKLLRSQAENYATNGSKGPVIAAGSTGSIPATTALLTAISQMDNGIVVLPALDRDLDDATWEKVDLPDNDRDDSGVAPGHPQYGLKQLLNQLGMARSIDEIRHLDNPFSNSYRVRETLISEALRPGFSTSAWQSIRKRFTAEECKTAFENVSLIESKGEREEALAIALAMRETLQDEDKTTALVTPDRNLARRVAVEMRRFGITVDDSAGQPLRNRPAGTFARLVLQVAYGEPDPVALMGLVKHPHARFGRSSKETRHAARLFELAIMRGALSPPVAGSFHAMACDVKRQTDLKKKSVPRSVKRFSPEDWQDLQWLCSCLDKIYSMPDKRLDGVQSVSALAEQSIRFIEASARDENGNLDELYNGQDGEALSALLEELLDHGGVLEASCAEWPEVFEAFLASRTVRPTGGTHPRVSILGPLEARLQTWDRVVLGGLNEKTWPGDARNDPFLSRPMKSALGLPPPERRTGLAAHDFQVLLGMNDVVMTRSVKADNAPTIASRWIQRLCIVVGEDATVEMRQRGDQYNHWARLIDLPAQPPKACAQPRPRPPVEVRPTELSITEIETWIADPYAIYAKHILKLDALDPLLRNADARERGILYHNIMEEFVKTVKDPSVDDALEQLLDIAKHQFATSEIPDEQTALWWPRFKTIAAAFLQWQRQHQPNTTDILTELFGQSDLGLDGFTLRGRVDRIDRMEDGRIALFDYKTGMTPYPSSVKNLTSPQLPLEAAMAMRGAFGDELQAAPSELTYLRLRPKDELNVDRIGGDDRSAKDPSAEQLADFAWENLHALIMAYRDPQKDYRSKARLISDKDWPSDYDHLARVREWSVGDDGEDNV